MTQPPDQEPPVEGENTDPTTNEGEGPSSGPEPVPAPEPSATQPAEQRRPSFLFLGIVSIVSLAADLGTKWWALHTLENPLPSGHGIPAPIELTPWLTLLLARNRGGAWGLLQTANEEIRKPFFLIISIAAIAFIVYLYRKIHPKQHALKWGLPLVLGGAIGNLVDQVRYGWVIDFIDYKAQWVRWLNEQIAKIWSSHAVTDHWPTFNIADVAICIGVGLMAVDMFTSRKVTKDGKPAETKPSSEPEDTDGEDDGPSSSSPSEDAKPAEQSKV